VLRDGPSMTRRSTCLKILGKGIWAAMLLAHALIDWEIG
jgi:hypothetical protein